jgi:aryl carrier-like protein
MGDRADVERLRRQGHRVLPEADALALFDAALRTGRAVLVPAAFDTAALRTQADAGVLPAVLADLVPTRLTATVRPRTGIDKWTRGLAGRPDHERLAITVDNIRQLVAGILGHHDHAAIDPHRGLLDLGLDSLTAVELRNRLNAETGLRLGTTLVFDHPTVAALATRVVTDLASAEQGAAPPAGHPDPLEQLERDLADADDEARDRLAGRLRQMLASLRSGPVITDATTDDEMFTFIDDNLGLSDGR